MLPKISRCGIQLEMKTLSETPSMFPSNFQITRCGMEAKVCIRANLISGDRVLVFITEPKLNKITPCFASSIKVCRCYKKVYTSIKANYCNPNSYI